MFKHLGNSLIIALLLSATALAQGPKMEFTANAGQWHENVVFRSEVDNGALFLEQDAFTWLFWSGSALDEHGHGHSHGPGQFQQHAYQMQFVGANTYSIDPIGQKAHHQNFFLGNDPDKWASNVPVHSGVNYNSIYTGIDLHIYGHGGGLKYDLIVAPNADIGQIEMGYQGVDKVFLQDGNLHVQTSVNEVVEQAPVAWQMVNGTKTDVPVRFLLNGNSVGFEFPEGFDNSLELVIDPVLTFASYSGSTANNFGFTATYDEDGNLYGGGIVFSVGDYPTTLGAFQTVYGGGTIDIGITKFSADGSTLLYSTLIGGSANESPHSLVVNSANELLILGTSGSADFPTALNAYDNTFAGGPSLTFTAGYGYLHSAGTDIVLSKLSADGSQLLGSTFFGGTDNDGLNNSNALSYNYGDAFRGEIVLDAAENILIASSTSSSDLQTTAGAPQSLYGGGGQDALVARFNSNLSSLLFSTYHGGSDDDSGFGIQLNSAGEIYVTGGTASPNLPTAGIPLNGSYNGSVDGYVTRYSASGNNLLACTFLGTNAYDQSYFVQLDTDDNVYVVGQTDGAYPVSVGVWSNPNSGQFIHKLSADLSSSEWSTTIGTGSGFVDISPSAFLVSNCGQIYLSGWGGTTNVFAQATNSTTTGLTVTPDAVQGTTDGSDFYLMVLDPDAADLTYATFFGGSTSNEHVDGGTSRFDKDGSVYQAVCAGCGGHDDFPTTAGAWSNINGNSCNLGVFKFDLSPIAAQIDINGPAYVCIPDAAEFLNLSIGGSDHFWDFGDGNTSNDFEPTHFYQDTGTYVVQFILTDNSACAENDTTYLTIEVFDALDARIEPIDSICEGASVQLFASGGVAYEWFPATGLNQTNVASPTATPPSNGFIYNVVVIDSCSVDTISLPVFWLHEAIGIDPTPTICAGDTVQLSAYGGGTYSWLAGANILDLGSPTPRVFPVDTSTFHVEITTPNGCLANDSIEVLVDPALPLPSLLNDTICLGENTQLFASGGTDYEWLPADGLNDLFIPDPVVEPEVSTMYVLQVSNACGTLLDTAQVEVIFIEAEAWSDTIICPGDSVQIFAAGGTSYAWSPNSLTDPSIADPVAFPTNSTAYTIMVSDNHGCTDQASVLVDVHVPPSVDAGNDATVVWSESVLLNGTGSGTFYWWPEEFLDDPNLEDPLATPTTTTTFTVVLTDTNGCTARDEVIVNVIGTLYVPNTFSPNNDGVNDLFFATGLEIKTFNMMVFNRWGEMIFETNSLTQGWNGTYKGTDSPIDTYVWKIDLIENSGDHKEVVGHVNLIR